MTTRRYIIPQGEMLTGYSDGTVPIPEKYEVTEDVFAGNADRFELPRVSIAGPESLTVGENAEYRATLSGGAHDSVVGYRWSCAGTGQKDTTTVDTAGRSEGLISICCVVKVRKGNVEAEAIGTGSIFVEEPD